MCALERYHIRIRGKVLGPFRREQVLQMIERGQLTRRHEVSLDGLAWRSAGDFSELFAPQSTPADTHTQPVTANVSPQVTAATPGRQVPEIVWYYECDGSPKGPVPEWQLGQLIAKGVVGASNRVWKTGMADWQRLHATELARYLPLTAESRANSAVGPKRSCDTEHESEASDTELLLNVGSSSSSDAERDGDVSDVPQLLLDNIRVWSRVLAAYEGMICTILLILAIRMFGLQSYPWGVLLLLGCIGQLIPLAYLFTTINYIPELDHAASPEMLRTVLTRWRLSLRWQIVIAGISFVLVILALIMAFS